MFKREVFMHEVFKHEVVKNGLVKNEVIKNEGIKNEVIKNGVIKNEVFNNEVNIIMTIFGLIFWLVREYGFIQFEYTISAGIGSCIALNAGIAPAASKGEVIPGKTMMSLMGSLSCEQGICPGPGGSWLFPLAVLLPSKEGESPSSSFHSRPPHQSWEKISLNGDFFRGL